MAEWWDRSSLPPSGSNDPRYFFDYNDQNQPRYAPPQAQSSLPPGPLPPVAMPPPLPPSMLMPPPPPPPPAPMMYMPNPPKTESPRELRNKAEKQRRDNLNQSIALLAATVPPVRYSNRKIDKTGVLRYTAHYLRVHQYIFESLPELYQFSHSSVRAILNLLNGFLIATTYKGLIVVVSQNITDYLGYHELDLLGRSVFGMIHEEDQSMLRNQLIPRSHAMGKHGELLMPDDQAGRERIAQEISNEKRQFIMRFVKLGNRTDPKKYVNCHVEGVFRVSDRALKGKNRCCQMVRRARARCENPCASGNDVVFIGLCRPYSETFINESALETYRMEYRTRHSIDGQIIQCEQRIALVTGYMMSEVSGLNAMNFIHRDEVRWVIIALKEMFTQRQLYGESCYRLVTRNGQFIYMRTRGRLDVDICSRAVTSFLCTNTVVDEAEGKALIQMMKERYMFQAYAEGHPALLCPEDTDSETVEDPQEIKEAILDMVTGLPSTETGGVGEGDLIDIVAPIKERIVHAIHKIHTVMTPSTMYRSPRRVTRESGMQIKTQRYVTEATQEAGAYSEVPEEQTQTRSIAEFPSFEELLQAQTRSEENNSDTYNLDLSSDFGAGACSLLTGALGITLDAPLVVDSPLPEMTLEFFASGSMMPDPSLPSSSTAGVKRPNGFDDQENTCKKKAPVANDQASTSESLTLETFFDDETLDTHIQSAIESLDGTVDPTFPNFLTLSEVEDILEAANSERQNSGEGQNGEPQEE